MIIPSYISTVSMSTGRMSIGGPSWSARMPGLQLNPPGLFPSSRQIWGFSSCPLPADGLTTAILVRGREGPPAPAAVIQ